jgi:hypothetical protein
MQQSIQDSIKQLPALAAKITQASQLLEDELGASSSIVRADWGMSQDERGRPIIDLTLSD